MTRRTSMAEHSSSVQWRFVVPPANDRRIVIEQRTDGPFRGDAVGAKGFYYTSVEVIDRAVPGQWNHVPGSSTGGHHSFEEAKVVAERFWLAALEKTAGSAV